LRASLDKDKGGDIATNLDALYEYIGRQLLSANLDNNEAILDEVSGLLVDVKMAWDAINVPEGTMERAAPVTNQVVPEVVEKPVVPVNSRANKALKAYSI